MDAGILDTNTVILLQRLDPADTSTVDRG